MASVVTTLGSAHNSKSAKPGLVLVKGGLQGQVVTYSYLASRSSIIPAYLLVDSVLL
jgi:hypothetical protein